LEHVAVLGSSSDTAGFGGKGRTLNQLVSLRLPVPEGFVITTEGVKALAQGDPLIEELISRAIVATSGDFFAVRSSSAAEDGGAASFAGQHETLLGVQNDGIIAAIRHCVSSLNTPRAEVYRDSMGVESDEMAVVVQKMVAAEASAVAFTNHPITGDEDSVFINATLGLGEPLVSGEITPDTFVVRKHSGQIVQRDIGPKEFVDVLGPSGIERRHGPHEAPSLQDDDLIALAEMCLMTEGQLGYAIDAELALKQGAWWLLQARPITT
jgi:pyruvate,water dikinase